MLCLTSTYISAIHHFTPSHAVVTVPACFDDVQRQATKDACRIAGLEVRVVSKSAAAALAYGLNRTDSSVLAVYELGGGTSDISILAMRGGVFEVKSTSGDAHLGGDDFDIALTDHVLREYQKESGIDLSKDPLAVHRIRQAAEQAKIELSSYMQAHISIPSVAAGPRGPQDIDMDISHAQFEALTRDLVTRIQQLCRNALRDAGVNAGSVDKIVLSGGTAHIPGVFPTVKSIFGHKPIIYADADETPAIGASIQGGILTGNVTRVNLIDVTALSLGFELYGGIMAIMIKRNTPIPARHSGIFTTVFDYQTEVPINVYQGERDIAKQNKLLGGFTLLGVLHALRGVPKIEVTFRIDAGELRVLCWRCYGRFMPCRWHGPCGSQGPVHWPESVCHNHNLIWA